MPTGSNTIWSATTFKSVFDGHCLYFFNLLTAIVLVSIFAASVDDVSVAIAVTFFLISRRWAFVVFTLIFWVAPAGIEKLFLPTVADLPAVLSLSVPEQAVVPPVHVSLMMRDPFLFRMAGPLPNITLDGEDDVGGGIGVDVGVGVGDGVGGPAASDATCTWPLVVALPGPLQ